MAPLKLSIGRERVRPWRAPHRPDRSAAGSSARAAPRCTRRAPGARRQSPARANNRRFTLVFYRVLLGSTGFSARFCWRVVAARQNPAEPWRTRSEPCRTCRTVWNPVLGEQTGRRVLTFKAGVPPIGEWYNGRRTVREASSSHYLDRRRRARSALIQRCAARDEDACAELVTEHQRMVYQLSLNLLGDHNEALDLSQEVFLRVFRTIHAFRGQSACAPGSTASSSTRRGTGSAGGGGATARSRSRSTSTSSDHGELPEPGNGGSPDRLLGQKQLAERIRGALDGCRSIRGRPSCCARSTG